MTRLLSIEWFKLRHSKFFWILSACFLLFMLAVPIGSKVIIDFAAAQGERVFSQIPLEHMPFFDFVDVWQNLTWIYTSFSILLGFIIIISMSDEFRYGNIKQHVIDGLSRRHMLHTKLSYIVVSSLFVTGITAVIGLCIGFAWSPVHGLPFILKHIEFLGGYFLHLIAFQLFCLIVSLWIKRSGIAISLVIFYTYVIEPIAVAIIRFRLKLDWLADLLPLEAIGNVIRFPFGKYALQESQSYISAHDLIILLAYMTVMFWLADRYFQRRDLS